MPIGTGVFKKLAFKKQTALNTKAPAGAAGTAKYLRRVSSTLDLAKATYSSAEILPSQQRRDMRHGVRSVAGTIRGEYSVGGYQQFIESALRRLAIAGATTGALTNVTIASAGAGTRSGTLTRATGSYLTDGFKVGDVVRASGAGAGAYGDLNLLITALTATVMTVRTLNGTDLGAVASGSSITIALTGRKTFAPQTGHTRDYYTIEHFYSDIPDSEQFVDCVIGGFTLAMPATGMSTIEFPVMGLNMETSSSEYFTTPAAAPTGGVVAAANGVLLVNGAVVATLTGLTITVAGNYAAPGGVVGSNVDPDILPGVMDVTGSATALFVSGAMRDLFLNETEFSILAALTADNTAAAGVVGITLPRVKFTGNTKDDSQTALTQTLPFTALENTVGGTGVASEATSISIQDSAFV